MSFASTLDGNLAALAAYESRYAREMAAQDTWEACMEVEAKTVIGYMMKDKEYVGKECYCCGNTIGEAGYIKAFWQPWDDPEDIQYDYYCEECKSCAE